MPTACTCSTARAAGACPELPAQSVRSRSSAHEAVVRARAVPAFVQVVVEVVDPAHVAQAAPARRNELLAHEDLVEHGRKALVDVRIGHVLLECRFALHLVGVEQRHVARGLVVGHLGGGGHQLRGDAVRVVVEVAHHHQRRVGALQQVDHDAAQSRRLHAAHDQRAQRSHHADLAVLPVFQGMALRVLQELRPLRFEVHREHVHLLPVLHAQRGQKGRALEARVRAQARHLDPEAGRKVDEGPDLVHLQPRGNADPRRALRARPCRRARRARGRRRVLRAGDRDEVVAQAAARNGGLQRAFVPDLLHREHVGIERMEALAGPGDLAFVFALVVGLLVLVVNPVRVREIQQVAGGDEERGVVGRDVLHGTRLCPLRPARGRGHTGNAKNKGHRSARCICCRADVPSTRCAGQRPNERPPPPERLPPPPPP